MLLISILLFFILLVLVFLFVRTLLIFLFLIIFLLILFLIVLLFLILLVLVLFLFVLLVLFILLLLLLLLFFQFFEQSEIVARIFVVMYLQRRFVGFDRFIDLAQFCVTVSYVMQCLKLQLRIFHLLKRLQRLFIFSRFVVAVSEIEKRICFPLFCQLLIVGDRLVVRLLSVRFLRFFDFEKVQQACMQARCKHDQHHYMFHATLLPVRLRGREKNAIKRTSTAPLSG